MLSYCLKCQRNTESIDPKALKNENLSKHKKQKDS